MVALTELLPKTKYFEKLVMLRKFLHRVRAYRSVKVLAIERFKLTLGRVLGIFRARRCWSCAGWRAGADCKPAQLVANRVAGHSIGHHLNMKINIRGQDCVGEGCVSASDLP